MVFVSSEGVCSIPWKTFLSTKVQTLIQMFSTRTVSMLITMNQMLRRTPAGLSVLAYVFGSGVISKNSRPWFGLHSCAVCRTRPMTIAWLRVVLKNITSPPNPINPILLLMSSKFEWSLVESSQPHVRESMFLLFLSFIFYRAIITCTMTSHRIHHVSHHILPSSLPPRDSKWWICDIIKTPCYSCIPSLPPSNI